MQFHADMALDEAEPGVKAVRVGAARRRSELDQLAIARAALVDRPQDHPFAEALTAQVADDAHRLDQPAPASDELGRAHVCTPVTNAHHVYRLLLGKKTRPYTTHAYSDST